VLCVIAVVLGDIISVDIDYSGSGFCSICGSTSYSVSSYNSSGWNNGVRVFQDPVPHGYILQAVFVETLVAIWCGTTNNVSFTLQSELIGLGKNGYLCACSQCPTPVVIKSNLYDSWPGYNYGGLNMVQVTPDLVSVIGLRTLRLNMDVVATSGTVSVDVDYSGQGFCQVCGSASYSVSSSPTQGWNNGLRTFVDPLPDGASLQSVTAQSIVGIFCGSGMNYGTVSLAGTFLGSLNSTYYCSCNSCPPVATAVSTEYTSWPGYNYGGINNVQVVAVGSSVIGLRTLRLTLAYILEGKR
jgi:hypothetical protein